MLSVGRDGGDAVGAHDRGGASGAAALGRPAGTGAAGGAPGGPPPRDRGGWGGPPPRRQVRRTIRLELVAEVAGEDVLVRAPGRAPAVLAVVREALRSEGMHVHRRGAALDDQLRQAAADRRPLLEARPAAAEA